MLSSRKIAFWRSIALISVGVDFIIFAVFSVDSITNGKFEFIADHFDQFSSAILIATLVLIVGLIGWFKALDQQRRARLGRVVLMATVVTCLIAGLVVGTNFHGYFPLFAISLFPVAVLGLILMSVGAKSRDV